METTNKLKNLLSVKFIVTALMMITTLYIYSVMRGVKDTLVVANMGAEIISSIKLLGVLPSAILAMLIYTKMVDKFTRLQIYYILNTFFAGFFLLFNYLLYPNAASFHYDLSEWIAAAPQLKYPLLMIANWSYSLFYILAELWGTLMLSLMFWQFANQINSVDEAKVNYPLYGLIAQLGLVAAGELTRYFTSMGLAYETTLEYITISVIASVIVLCLAIWYISNFVVEKDIINGAAAKKKKKVKMGFGESLMYIFSNRYILLIATLVVCYGISINLVEGVWKKALQLRFPAKNDYNAYMGALQTWTGIFSAVAMLSASYLLNKLSWRTAALLTPIMILVTGAGFFIFFIMRDNLEALSAEMFGLGTIAVATILGLAQNVISKATKYSFFDPTKEMTYIPLSEELKAKGKAAADVIGGRLGKSGGALVQMTMLSFVVGSTLVDLAPNLFVIFIVVMVAWIAAVFALNVEFQKQQKLAAEGKSEE
jgi:AAA family ATP:ADP antiporter